MKCVSCAIAATFVLAACLGRPSSGVIVDNTGAKEPAQHQKYDPDAPQYNDDPGV